ncbi:MAG TPA: hypothetical protein VHA13_05325, partial [Gammaproteobacteria bacterium]|nr:hypothetical protein [Gammaproteobacteria bacterium]
VKIDEVINNALAHNECPDCNQKLQSLVGKIGNKDFRLWNETKDNEGRIIAGQWKFNEEYNTLKEHLDEYKNFKKATIKFQKKPGLWSRIKQGFNNFTNNHPYLWWLIKWIVIPAALSAAFVFSGGFAALASLTLTVGMQWASFAMFTAAFSFLINGINHLHTSAPRKTVSSNEKSSKIAGQGPEGENQKKLNAELTDRLKQGKNQSSTSQIGGKMGGLQSSSSSSSTEQPKNTGDQGSEQLSKGQQQQIEEELSPPPSRSSIPTPPPL